MKQSKAVQAMLIAGTAFLIACSVPAADIGTGAAADGPAASLSSTGSTTTAGTNAVALQLPGSEQQQEELVSIDVVDTEITEVIKIFTHLPGVSIVVGTNISGKVTAHIQNKPWKTALDAVLAQRGLRLDDPTGKGVYEIVGRSLTEPLVTETIFLRFAEVPSVINALKNSLDPRGKIADFASRNAMVIQSTQRNLTEIRAIVEQIDIPRGQVVVEAQFVQLGETTGSDIGVGWDSMLKQYQVGYKMSLLNSSETISKVDNRNASLDKTVGRQGEDGFSGTYNVRGSTLSPGAAAAAAGAAAGASVPTRTVSDSISKGLSAADTIGSSYGRMFDDTRTAVLSPLEFNLVLSALKSRGGTVILSKPKIIVANGEQATIHIGREQHPFFATVTPPNQYSASITTYNPGPAVQFGVKINVTPTINTGSNITVAIEPELTDLYDIDKAPDGKTSYPITTTKKIKTQFTLQNWRTAAIGGLTTMTDTKDANKVPLLSDIPLIGKYLFSHETTTRDQQEMIIFVTVGIVTPDAADEKTGIPTDAELIRTYQLDRSAANAAFQNSLERQQADTDKNTERTEKRKKLILNRIK